MKQPENHIVVARSHSAPRRFSFLPFLLLLFQAFHASAAAQVSDAIGAASLAGLTGFSVSVGELRAESQPAGLTAEQLRDAAEARLRAAGIGIVPASAWLDSAGSAQLYIEANVLRFGGTQYSFALQVSVIQKATLGAKGGRQTLAVTWSSSSMGIAGARDAASTIKEQTGELLGRLIDGYRLSNPPAKKE